MKKTFLIIIVSVIFGGFFAKTEATVYTSIIEARDECFNLPLEEEVYVGFKYVDENGTRLGWIKLIVEHDANGDLIARPLETAIQKEYME